MTDIVRSGKFVLETKADLVRWGSACGLGGGSLLIVRKDDIGGWRRAA
jgi:hypothetical protein